MTFAIIVQARFGSTRLPGKVLEPIGEKIALLRCLDRCARTPGVDAVVCAVPEAGDSDPVAHAAQAAGYRVVRGPEGDVLARYARAARAVGAHRVMRVTSDCPLIDPVVCGRVRDLFVESGADYASNSMPPSWPHGLDCEIFLAETLYRAEREAHDAYAREHVTPWIRRNAALRRASLAGPGGDLAKLRWTLDHPEDLAFFRAVFASLGEAAAHAPWETIAALCQAQPQIAAINAMRIDAARLADPLRADIVRACAA